MKLISRIFLLLIVVLLPQVTKGIGHGDFSSLSFTQAFDSLYSNFSICYPFTSWKAIDWQDLYDEYSLQIEEAQNSNDTSSFKLAIRRFIHSFPDGHVRVQGEFQEIFFGEIGGGFGLTLIELDDGSIVVNRIISGGPAEQEGIEVGAVIKDWNGLPLNEALQNTDIIWEGKPPATLEATRLAQFRRLIRMPVETHIEITFSNPGQDHVKASLTAVDDGMETWDLTNYTKFSTNGSVNLTLDDVFNPVQYEILESGYGYLKNRILVEFDSQGNLLPTYNNIYNSLKEAIDYFSQAQVPGVIIDIRDNPGGFDKLAALLASFFYDHTELYEHASFYNPETEQFEILESFTIYLEPQESYYGGQVICLVNAGTSSSAEGVAMAIQRLPHGQVLGFYGTHGSFALTSGETLMPAGLAVSYPLGRSLDDKYAIQIDSDSTKNGGVIPDIRVPFTRENMNAMFVDSEDVVLNYAIKYLNDISSLINNQGFQPKTPQLLGNYPNPFNPETIIRYNLPKSTKVKINVYDITGHRVQTLVKENKTAGSYEIVFDGSQLANGVYIYTLEAGGFRQMKKMILLK